MEKLTPNEEEAMQVIWNLCSGTIKDFLNNLSEPKPPYTTLASTVKNLEKKKFISAMKIGNTYVYAPKIKEEEYSNSYKELVSFFATQEKISTDELKEIIEMIEKGRKP